MTISMVLKLLRELDHPVRIPQILIIALSDPDDSKQKEKYKTVGINQILKSVDHQILVDYAKLML